MIPLWSVLVSEECCCPYTVLLRKWVAVCLSVCLGSGSVVVEGPCVVDLIVVLGLQKERSECKSLIYVIIEGGISIGKQICFFLKENQWKPLAAEKKKRQRK